MFFHFKQSVWNKKNKNIFFNFKIIIFFKQGCKKKYICIGLSFVKKNSINSRYWIVIREFQIVQTL